MALLGLYHREASTYEVPALPLEHYLNQSKKSCLRGFLREPSLLKWWQNPVWLPWCWWSSPYCLLALVLAPVSVPNNLEHHWASEQLPGDLNLCKLQVRIPELQLCLLVVLPLTCQVSLSSSTKWGVINRWRGLLSPPSMYLWSIFCLFLLNLLSKTQQIPVYCWLLNRLLSIT